MSLLEPLAGEAPVPTGFSDEWYTPRWWLNPLFAIVAHRLDGHWSKLRGFGLDVCASKESAKCERYFDIYSDGLTQQWDAVWWCNPPYSGIPPWIDRAVTAVLPGFMLLPAWTDRAWWQQHVEPLRDAAREFGLNVEAAFHRRISFGYPGNPECDDSILREHQQLWRSQRVKDPVQGSKIYPVVLAFIPTGWDELRGAVREHWQTVTACRQAPEGRELAPIPG